MVGFDGFFLQLLDKLTGVPSRRQVIPIVGMGGIGKTFLARNAFKDPLIVQHFDICLWATISQQYKVEKILSELVSGLRRFHSKNSDESTSYRTVDAGLDEELYKGLCGRRYLIILDDMWSVEAWYGIRSLFPDKDDGSRIVVTTRHSYVASHLNISWLEIRIQNEDNSWNLFCQKAFAEKGCPPELEEIGKKIVGKCRGLPLAIVVAGGHLRNSSMAPQYWENVANHMDSILNSTENEEQCLDVLSLSYSYMPPHLKPCFLLLGAFLVLDSTRAINQERRVVISGEEVAEANHQTRTFDAPIRFLVYDGGWPPCDLPSSISRLWNLQILEIHLDPNWSSVIAPYEIWEMLQLRHLEITSIYLLDPIPAGDKANELVLGNLQTLWKVENFRFSEEVCKRIPYIKELHLQYRNEASSYYCPHNLCYFHELVYFLCDFDRNYNWRDFARSLIFPNSLKWLSLSGCRVTWEEMITMAGSLPHLIHLRLFWYSVTGSVWTTVEGKFPSLKCLEIWDCHEVVQLEVESSHFPVLEKLVLKKLSKLDELPGKVLQHLPRLMQPGLV